MVTVMVTVTVTVMVMVMVMVIDDVIKAGMGLCQT